MPWILAPVLALIAAQAWAVRRQATPASLDAKMPARTAQAVLAAWAREPDPQRLTYFADVLRRAGYPIAAARLRARAALIAPPAKPSKAQASGAQAGQGGGDYSVGDLLGGAAGGGVAEAKAAWSAVSDQLTAEGAPAGDIDAAKHAFTDAYNQLNRTASYTSAADLASAAGKYIRAGRTAAGAIEHLGDLVAAGTSGDPPPAQVANTFMGTMIGIVVAAGGLSAGVGAVIMAAVTAVLGLFQELGFFGSPPKGQEVCPGAFADPPAAAVLGACAVVQTTSPKGANGRPVNWPPATPGAGYWRRFPAKSNAEDFAVWYTQNGADRGGAWPKTGIDGRPYPYPDRWWTRSEAWRRLIDAAFPEYRLLECEQQSAACGAPGGTLAEKLSAEMWRRLRPPTPLQLALCDFGAAFFAAWQANKEYALNGLVPQDDWQVLVHVARVWNAAREVGTGQYILTPGPKPGLDLAALPPAASFPPGAGGGSGLPGGGGGAFGTPGLGTFSGGLPACTGEGAPLAYEAYLVGQAMGQGAAEGDPSLFRSGGLALNTGPKKAVKVVPPPPILLHTGKFPPYAWWSLDQWVDAYAPKPNIPIRVAPPPAKAA